MRFPGLFARDTTDCSRRLDAGRRPIRLHRPMVALTFVAFNALTIGTAFANPATDLEQLRKSFASLKSVHAEMKTAQISAAIDMVVPDKEHMSFSNGMQVIVVGSDSWTNMRGRWAKSPYARTNPIATQIEAVRNMGLTDITKNYTIWDAGPASLNGVPAHKYRLVSKDDGRIVDVWGGLNHLPLQIQFGGTNEAVTITYSRYNSVADITAPT